MSGWSFVIISKPSFLKQETFSKYLVATHKLKDVLTFNKPVYLYIRFA